MYCMKRIIKGLEGEARGRREEEGGGPEGGEGRGRREEEGGGPEGGEGRGRREEEED